VINGEAFRKSTKLSSVTIEEGVERIESGAFSGCTALSSISFPSTINYISTDAVSGTPWFSNLSDGLIYIGKVALVYKGNKVEDVSIKNGIESISDFAFRDSRITSVSMPNSLRTIGKYAFQNVSKRV